VTRVEGNLLSVRNNPTRRNQEAKTTLKCRRFLGFYLEWM
jgi:hypothetical protein